MNTAEFHTAIEVKRYEHKILEDAGGCLGYRMTRRHAIGRVLAGAAGLWLADSLAVRAWAATPVSKQPAKRGR